MPTNRKLFGKKKSAHPYIYYHTSAQRNEGNLYELKSNIYNLLWSGNSSTRRTQSWWETETGCGEQKAYSSVWTHPHSAKSLFSHHHGWAQLCQHANALNYTHINTAKFSFLQRLFIFDLFERQSGSERETDFINWLVPTCQHSWGWTRNSSGVSHTAGTQAPEPSSAASQGAQHWVGSGGRTQSVTLWYGKQALQVAGSPSEPQGLALVDCHEHNKANIDMVPSNDAGLTGASLCRRWF